MDGIGVCQSTSYSVGERSKDKGTPKGHWKYEVQCLAEDRKAFDIDQEGWTATHCLGTARVGSYDSVETGLNIFMAEWRRKEAAETTAVRHASAAAEGNPARPANTQWLVWPAVAHYPSHRAKRSFTPKLLC